MQTLKERKSLLVKMLATVLFVFMCYGLSVKTFHWAVCGEKEPHGLKFELFLMFCEKEKNEWFEKRFWEECTKNDKDIPPHTEVLISACKEPAVRGVPGGEVLFVIEDKTGESYFLDLRTGEKTPVPDGERLWDEGVFLSSDLVWLEGSFSPGEHGYSPHYILDLTDGRRYELVDLGWKYSDKSLDNGKVNPVLYSYFTEAGKVFIDYKKRYVIALAPNFRQQTKRNVVFSEYPIISINTEAENGKLLEQLMNDLGVDYEIVDYSLADADVPSPTGKYVARSDGLYFSETNLPIRTDAYSSGCFKSWFYDESAVIIDCGISGYLYQNPRTGRVSHPIPLPVLKLLLPTQ